MDYKISSADGLWATSIYGDFEKVTNTNEIKIPEDSVIKIIYNGKEFEFTPKEMFLLKELLKEKYPEYYV
jgi:hypothetical protein